MLYVYLCLVLHVEATAVLFANAAVVAVTAAVAAVGVAGIAAIILAVHVSVGVVASRVAVAAIFTVT